VAEIPKFVPAIGYEGLYEVNEIGTVRRAKDGRALKPYPDRYLRVRLYRNGKGIAYTVQQIVLESFQQRPDWATQVNHIDGNKHNNRLDNLEWSTAKLNRQHFIKVLVPLTPAGRIVKRSHNWYPGNSKLRPEEIPDIRKRLAAGETCRSIAQLYGVGNGTIEDIKNCRTWVEKEAA
jgi:hypothetical protein